MWAPLASAEREDGWPLPQRTVYTVPDGLHERATALSSAALLAHEFGCRCGTAQRRGRQVTSSSSHPMSGVYASLGDGEDVEDLPIEDSVLAHVLVCETCGTEFLHDNSRFCRMCGTPRAAHVELEPCDHGSRALSPTVSSTAVVAAAKFKQGLVKKRHRQRMTEFKEQRRQWQNSRQTGVLWTITLLTAATSLALGVCLGYVGTFRVDWWGHGCLEGEMKARESGAVRSTDEAMRCHTDRSTLIHQMWLLLASCLMEAIANVLYVVVTDVDLNKWFDAHPLAFALLAGAQTFRAIGHAIFFPECWLVVLAFLMGCQLRRGVNTLDKTDPLMAMMTMWPLALALQLVGWLGYLSQNWPVAHAHHRLSDDTNGCLLISVDHYGYINMYLKRLVALLCAAPLFGGTVHLLYRGFVDDSASRSEAFKRVYRLVWFYEAWFWAATGFLRIDGVVEWQPSESESRLFENSRSHIAAGVNDTLHHGGSEVVFDFAMAVFCFVPALVVQVFRERIWLWLARMFDQRQRLADGAFIAAMQVGHEELTEAAMVKLARKKLRRVRWSNIESNPDLLVGRRFSGSRADYDLSEPCEYGEIDFFISYAHADNSEAMFRELKAVAERFADQYDREPTFWLDKACIDPREMCKKRMGSDQLSCLPIFVMSCNRVLILHSTAYVKRLWCIWELYICFAMEVPMPRIQVVLIEPDLGMPGTDTEIGSGAPAWTALAEQLQNFDVDMAHCHSNLDERTIRAAIRVSGKADFNKTIKQIADQLSKLVHVDFFGASASELRSACHAGYMEKQFSLHHAMERRYFVALDHHLYVFEDPSHSHWQHAISLIQAKVTPESDDCLRVKFLRNNSHDDEYPYVSGRSGEWRLRCCNSSNRDEWLVVLQTMAVGTPREMAVDANLDMSTEVAQDPAVPANPRSLVGKLRRQQMKQLGQGKYYHAFLSHAWGKDGAGRDNHKRVSAINEMLKRRGVITWCPLLRTTPHIAATSCSHIDTAGAAAAAAPAAAAAAPTPIYPPGLTKSGWMATFKNRCVMVSISHSSA